jgi:hypothetical protein
MTLNLKDANTRFALLKAFADAIYSEIASNREIHTARLVDRYTEEGTKSFDVLLAGGVKVGSISLTIPKPTTTVTDPAAFLEWCEYNRPHDVYTVPGTPPVVIAATFARREVDPKATTTILAESRPADDGAVVDVSGVLIDGVTYTNGAVPSQFSVRYETDGREALALAYRRGELNELASGSALPAIEAAS